MTVFSSKNLFFSKTSLFRNTEDKPTFSHQSFAGLSESSGVAKCTLGCDIIRYNKKSHSANYLDDVSNFGEIRTTSEEVYRLSSKKFQATITSRYSDDAFPFMISNYVLVSFKP